jgi:hypothetical protein
MKKIAVCLLATCLSLTFIPLNLNASTGSPETNLPAPRPVESSEAKNMELRFNDINRMDKTNLKSSEKKNSGKSTASSNEKRRDIGGGVYISAGGLILILILLIILV